MDNPARLHQIQNPASQDAGFLFGRMLMSGTAESGYTNIAQQFGDTLFLDEVFVKINGKQHYLCGAVDQESLPHERSECFGYGEVINVYLQSRRNGATAKRFFKHILRRHGSEPRNIVTDKLKSYGVAHRELIHNTVNMRTTRQNNRRACPALWVGSD